MVSMFGWTTWGRYDPPNESYEEIGPLQLFKHWKGLIVGVPEGVPRDEAFLTLAQMNEWLEEMS